jgi:hypothetical protein
MKILKPKCLLHLLFAAQFSFASTGSEHQIKLNYNLHQDQSLDSYEAYLSSLNPNYLFNIAAAEKKFRKLFSGSPTYITNSAFICFWNFYLTAADYCGSNLSKNDNYKYFIGIKDYNINPGKYENLKLDLTLNKKILNDNDFRLLELLNSYGLMFDTKDANLIINFGSKDYIMNSFGNDLVPSFREYISETIKEAGEKFIENDRLVLPIDKLVERITWWENFLNKNKDFILASECRKTYEFYLNTLLRGIDNAGASANSLLLNREQKDDYCEIIKKFAGSKTAEAVSIYAGLILNNDLLNPPNNGTFAKNLKRQ